ncbi:hypothetical protein RhiirA5_182924 [Rhizophagus irregularis]|uniref:Uncharacterized protein n=1 Tax=Rhizophagus irregularis TaxID=588596 RepID=A0A2N0QAS8_9GLOM|nr:hypothetical protein RhiirA5_182924 [Rhizophagus irregularis]
MHYIKLKKNLRTPLESLSIIAYIYHIFFALLYHRIFRSSFIDNIQYKDLRYDSHSRRYKVTKKYHQAQTDKNIKHRWIKPLSTYR